MAPDGSIGARSRCWWRLATALPLAAAIAGLGWRRRALSGRGAAAAIAVGAATFTFGGWPGAAALLAFFASGSWLSRRPGVPGEVAAAKGHRRDAAQVLANGGVAALAAIAAGFGAGRAPGALVGGLAAAAADTWASEIGIGSAVPPRSIVTGQVVPPGSSGGVTARGWLAAAGGALLVGSAYAATARGGWGRTLPTALLAGLLGSLADSLAGGTVQAAYRCVACGAPSETPHHRCGAPATLVRGHAWVTNDVVNLTATSVGGLVGALAW